MSDLASANRVQMCIIPEAAFGVTPVSGNPANLRMTGESLDFARTKENDKEINASAELTSVSTVGAQASGDIKVHMQYGEYDPLFASVLRSAWSEFGVNGVGAAFGTTAITATTITADAPTSGASIFTNLKRGQWLKLIAANDSANNGRVVRVSTSVAPTADVLTLDASTPLAVAGALAGYQIASSRLTNGVTLSSFSVERQIEEVNQYMLYRGMYGSKFSTAFASGSLTEGTFSLLGKDMVRDVNTLLPGTPTESLTYDVQNAVTGVGNIWEAGAPMADTYIKSLSLDIDSGLRVQEAIGHLGAIGVGIGTFMVKGTIEVFFSDGALFEKYENDAFTSISFSTKDTDGNGYVFTMPRVQLTKASVMAGTKDTDLMASFEFTAYSDKKNAIPELRKTMFMDRFGDAVV